MLQNNNDDSDTTTDVAPTDGIGEENQQGSVVAQPDSNDATSDVQEKVAEPEVEGGIVPQEKDPQPDGVVSSKETDFHKAESE